MRTRTLLAAAATPVLAAAMTCAVPDTAAAASTTTVTFNVNGGLLAISAPGSAFIGSGTLGSTVTGPLGIVTVNDARGATLDASWSATVSSTSFITNGGGANQTIPNSSVSYWSGPALTTSGAGTFTPAELTAGNAVALNVTQSAFSHTGGSGGNTATWDPDLIILLPEDIVTGTYTGTVTHSVA